MTSSPFRITKTWTFICSKSTKICSYPFFPLLTEECKCTLQKQIVIQLWFLHHYKYSCYAGLMVLHSLSWDYSIWRQKMSSGGSEWTCTSKKLGRNENEYKKILNQRDHTFTVHYWKHFVMTFFVLVLYTFQFHFSNCYKRSIKYEDCTQDCSSRHRLTFSAVATVLTSSVNSLWLSL